MSCALITVRCALEGSARAKPSRLEVPWNTTATRKYHAWVAPEGLGAPRAVAARFDAHISSVEPNW